MLLGKVVTGPVIGRSRFQFTDGPVFANKGATAPTIVAWDYLAFVDWEHHVSGPWVGVGLVRLGARLVAVGFPLGGLPSGGLLPGGRGGSGVSSWGSIGSK